MFPLALIAAPATNSGLIVFLPVVTAFLGAVIGAVAAGLVRAWQDKKARDLEREGLVRLIAAEIATEIATNQSAITTLSVTEKIGFDLRATVRTTVWDEAKVSLAQLMPADHIAPLTEYYSAISVALHDFGGSKGWLSSEMKRQVNNLGWLGEHVLRNAEENITDPNFVKWLRTTSSQIRLTDEDAQ